MMTTAARANPADNFHSGRYVKVPVLNIIPKVSPGRPSESYLPDNDFDEEEDIVTDKNDSTHQASKPNVNLEIGVSSGLVRVV
jgi:hypothetical protein